MLRGILGAVCLGAFACSVVLDLSSVRRAEQFLGASAAFDVLTIGLVVGALAAIVGAAAIAASSSTGARRRRELLRLLAFDLVLAWFALAYARRSGTPIAVESVTAIGASALAVAVLGALWWGALADGGSRGDPSEP